MGRQPNAPDSGLVVPEPSRSAAHDPGNPPSRTGVPPWLETGGAWAGRALLLVAVAVLVAVVVSRLLIVVVPVLLALFVASVLHRPTRWLGHRLPDTVASLLVVTGVVVLAAAFVALVVVPAAVQGPQFAGALQDGLARVAGSVGVPPDEVVAGAEQAGKGLLEGGGALAGLSTALELAGGAVLAVIVLFFFLREGEGIWRGALVHVGEPRRAPLERFGRRAWSTLRGYFVGVTIVATMDAILIALALVVIGVPFVLPLATLTFAAVYFPVVGAVAAGVVGTLVAFVTVGPTSAVVVAAAYLILQQLEANVLYPYVMRSKVALHPLTTILAVTIGGTLAGVLGAFLSIPVAAVISGTVREERGPTPE